MYLISCHKKGIGISSVQLSTDISVMQKTAWYILHKVRTLFAQEDVTLSGVVECDEMYLGGRETNKHDSKKTEKTHTYEVAKKVTDTKAATLIPIIELFVSEGSTVVTDELTLFICIFEIDMNAEEFKRELTEYTGQREQAFYWVEVPKTMIWHDAAKNELCSDLGISIKCDEYESVWECINDLCDAVAAYYENKGIYVHETSA